MNSSKYRRFIGLTGLTVSFISFSSMTAQAATAVNVEKFTQKLERGKEIHQLLSLDNNNHFITKNKVELSNGIVKTRLAQNYKGVPIWGYGLTSNLDTSGYHDNLSGVYLSELEKDLRSTVPTLNKETAIKNVIQSVPAELQNKITTKTAILYIRLNEQGIAELVYLVSILIENGDDISQPMTFVNANTGLIIHQWQGLTSRLATGPGGNEKSGKYMFGTDYGSLDVTEDCQMMNQDVVAYDMRNQNSGTGLLFKFICPVNNYRPINGAYSPLNDAFYFSDVVFDLYRAWFNIPPLKSQLKIRVHFSNNFENAYWDGSQVTFGDGGQRMYPLVSEDVVAHEISHGFTQQNSNLAYEKQSGALNESFSDIAGQAVQYFINKNKPEDQRNDWLVGSKIIKGAGNVMRYFADPTKDGRSIGHAKDYTDGMDVHNSSGVFNKAFYTLAQTPNWSVEKSFRAFVLANQVYWNESSNFVDAACGVTKAASDLKFSTADVRAAFLVVGVPVAATCGNSGGDPTPTPGETELKDRTPIKGLAGAISSEKLFYIDVTEESYQLSVQTYGGSGDVDLYLQYAEKPTSSQNLCNSTVKSNNESCTVLARAGRYYVMLKGYLPYNGVTLLSKTTRSNLK